MVKRTTMANYEREPITTFTLLTLAWSRACVKMPVFGPKSHFFLLKEKKHHKGCDPFSYPTFCDSSMEPTFFTLHFRLDIFIILLAAFAGALVPFPTPPSLGTCKVPCTIGERHTPAWTSLGPSSVLSSEAHWEKPKNRFGSTVCFAATSYPWTAHPSSPPWFSPKAVTAAFN